jgi:hypothetical protein
VDFGHWQQHPALYEPLLAMCRRAYHWGFLRTLIVVVFMGEGNVATREGVLGSGICRGFNVEDIRVYFSQQELSDSD